MSNYQPLPRLLLLFPGFADRRAFLKKQFSGLFVYTIEGAGKIDAPGTH